MAFALREYQTKAVADVLAAWKDPTTILKLGKLPVVCLVAPTGAGKSEMAAAVLKTMSDNPSQCLVLVHTRVLYGQTMRRFPGVHVGTIQGLLAKGKAGDLRRARLARFSVVFIDEVHHLASDLWRGVLPLLQSKAVFGATATPVRSDGTPLGDVCDVLVVAAHYSKLLADGYLCRCDVQRSDLTRKFQKRNKVRPDGVKAYLANGAYAPGDPRGPGWRPGIYFDATIAQCTDAVREFNEAGVRAKLVCKDTKAAERQQIFNAYNAGELDMLASPMALSEGFDAPRAEVCVLRRMCEGLGGYIQIVGRVLRPFPGKERALLIDCAGASEPGHHGLPTNDRIYTLDGKGLDTAPEPDPEEEDEEEEEEDDPLDIEGPQTVEAKYRLVRDTLYDRYKELCAEAEAAEYKQGWVFHKFQEHTSITVPRCFAAKFASTCKHCRHKLTLGEQMFWLGSNACMHIPCWFQSLDAEALAKVPGQLPPIPRARRPTPQRTAQATTYDDDAIPF